MRFFAIFTVMILSASSALGFGDGGGGGSGSGTDSGCGGCLITFPESLEEDAKLLRKDFGKLSFQELLDQQILGTLCSNNNCRSLDEAQAGRLLDRAIAYERENVAAAARWEARTTTRLSAGLAIAGFCVAAGGLLVSALGLKYSKETDRLSTRNSVEIEHMQHTAETTGEENT